MAPIDKCLAVVRTLIGQGQSNGIGIAEKAINEYVDLLPVSIRKSGLQDVQLVVETIEGAPRLHLSVHSPMPSPRT